MNIDKTNAAVAARYVSKVRLLVADTIGKQQLPVELWIHVQLIVKC